MIILQVLGTNGAGKSTVLKTLASSGKVHVGEHGFYTVCFEHQLILVGDYTTDARTPGADKIRDQEKLLQALDEACHLAAHFGWDAVAWEGVMIITQVYFRHAVARGHRVVYLLLHLPEAMIFERIQARTGKTRDQLKGNGARVLRRVRETILLAAYGRREGALVVETDASQSPVLLAGNALWALQQVRGTPCP